MKNNRIVLLLGVFIASVAIIFTSCKKINEATELGGGLIPVIDNITTFDTSISVEGYNGLFTMANDTSRYYRGLTQYLGLITNDPLFGGSDARMFFELKSTNYPFVFMNSDPDSLRLDSIVLVLDYVETYGDTNVAQTVNVYEISQAGPAFKYDSNYLVRKNDFVMGPQLGTRTFAPAVLNDSIKVYKDTTRNQLRIRLDDSFGRRLLDYDTVPGANGAYTSDSAFRTKFKGFALQSVGGGNAVMGFNLGGGNTKLAIYYNYTKNGKDDTTVHYFRFTTLSAGANHVTRDHSFGEIAGVQGGASPDELLYLQNTPGAFADIKIPDFSQLSNRLLHRAELIVEQVYDPTDTVFGAPEYLFLDAYDPSIAAPKNPFRTIPYDFVFDGQDYNRVSFGSTALRGTDPNGKSIRIWKFNLTRYLQHVLTGTSTLYDLRLFAPFDVEDQYGIPPNIPDITFSYPYGPLLVNPTIVKGRVRVGGGNHPTQKMRLRLIYSKI